METKASFWKRLDWVNTAFLTLTPLAAVGGTIAHVYFEGFHAWIWVLLVIYYIPVGLGITGGYHRLFSHKAYEANPLLKLFYLIFGAAAFQNSALKWCTDHRIHHRYVDREEDPYNIKKGFFWAHMGWVFMKETNSPAFPPDLLADRLVSWQHKYYIPIAIFFGFLIPASLGLALGAPLGGIFVLGFLRIVLLHHSTFAINSLCHYVGKQNFSDNNSAMDSPLIALVSNGEGYHNFHHTFQADYRNGYRWYHFDPSKWFINVMKVLGFADKLHRTDDMRILSARLSMQEKQLKQKRAPLKAFEISALQNVKVRVEEAKQKWLEMKVEYQRLKKTLPSDSREKLDEIRANLKNAQKEFQQAYAQWVTQLHSLSVAYA